MKHNSLLPIPLRRRTVMGGAVAALALSACGGGGSSSSTGSVRLLNATLNYTSLDLLVNGTVSQSGIAQDAISSYVSAATTGTVFQVNAGGASNGLAAITPTLVANAQHILVALETSGTVSLVLIDENFDAPTSGSATLRVADYVLQAGKLDVYITTSAVADATALAALSPTGTLAPSASTGYVLSFTYGTGDYFVTLTGAGNPADIRIFNEPITLTSQEVATVIISPASGGLLVNAGFLVQQGSYTPFRSSTARVRVATSVTGNAVVAVSAVAGTTTVVDVGSVSPQLGSYVTVPADSTLQITVNGSSIAMPAGDLAAGGDYTILVSGSPGSATATLLTDDNRSSSDTTQAKLRLINAISGNASNLLTLTVNSITIASAIAPGTASGYATIPGSANNTNLVLYSNQHPGAYYSSSDFVFGAGGVYTVFATGDYSAPLLIVR